MAEKMKLEENQIFMDKLMEWREKARDWLAATTNEEIDAIFNVPRTIELWLDTLSYPHTVLFSLKFD